MWLDHFLAQGLSISAQPKKALVWVGFTCFAGPVGVRLDAYSNNALALTRGLAMQDWSCETSSARTYRLAVCELSCYCLIVELELLIIVIYDFTFVCTTYSYVYVAIYLIRHELLVSRVYIYM